MERWYADGAYGWIQPRLTAITDVVPWAVLDVLLGGVIAVLVVIAWRARRGGARGPRRGPGRRFGRALWRTAVAAAALYLLFLAVWGLNYRRAPLERRLDFDQRRVTTARVVALARAATDALNDLHSRAHASPWPATADLPRVLGPQLGQVATSLRLTWTPRPGVPKPTLLGPYFRWASIAGMTNPFGLEILPSPDTLPFEGPAVTAHEWAHLAGFAHEAEAGFVGWLVCQRGNAQAQYSGWLEVWGPLMGALGPAERKQEMARLAEGPRQDLRAIAARNARALPVVRDAAWRGYDAFLRSQHVAEGVRSYEGVVRLLAGTQDGSLKTGSGL